MASGSGEPELIEAKQGFSSTRFLLKLPDGGNYEMHIPNELVPLFGKACADLVNPPLPTDQHVTLDLRPNRPFGIKLSIFPSDAEGDFSRVLTPRGYVKNEIIRKRDPSAEFIVDRANAVSVARRILAICCEPGSHFGPEAEKVIDLQLKVIEELTATLDKLVHVRSL